MKLSELIRRLQVLQTASRVVGYEDLPVYRLSNDGRTTFSVNGCEIETRDFYSQTGNAVTVEEDRLAVVLR